MQKYIEDLEEELELKQQEIEALMQNRENGTEEND